LAGRRVLIVDDNALNIELAAFVLEAAGFIVDVAMDATQVRPRIDAARPDLILMDIQLPGVDGLEVTRQLKSDPATQGIAVAAFTAFAMKGDEAKMRAAGCDGYIAKPIDVRTFASQVSACLGAASAWPGGANGTDFDVCPR
jgi:two-component system cell cycle response regulator DivK